MSDDKELAGVFNHYFINIASNLKEPIENTDLSKLKSYISSKVPDNFQFELPNIDENFVFNFLSTLDVSKATGLDGVGPRLLTRSIKEALKMNSTVTDQFLFYLPCQNY